MSRDVLIFIIVALQLGTVMFGGIQAARTRDWGSCLLIVAIVAGIILLLGTLCASLFLTES